MDTNLLDIKFVRIGARLKVADRPSWYSRTSGVISLDVRTDSKDEFFEIAHQAKEALASSLQVQEPRRFRDRLRADLDLVASYVAAKKVSLASGVTDSGDYFIRKGWRKA